MEAGRRRKCKRKSLNLKYQTLLEILSKPSFYYMDQQNLTQQTEEKKLQKDFVKEISNIDPAGKFSNFNFWTEIMQIITNCFGIKLIFIKELKNMNDSERKSLENVIKIKSQPKFNQNGNL
jgi:hypothetical protein